MRALTRARHGLALTRARHGLAAPRARRFSSDDFASRVRRALVDHVNNFDAGRKLAEGSLAARLHAFVTAHVNQGLLFNVCQLCSLGASLSMEWTAVRCFLIGSSASWMVFHSSFPLPRPTRIAWSTLFCLTHARSLYLHLAEERDVTLAPDDEALYEAGFAPHGFTKWQFQQLFASAVHRTLGEGEYLFEEGEPIDRVTILVEGAYMFTWHQDLDMSMTDRLRLRAADPDGWRRRALEHCTVPIAITPRHKGLYIVTTHGAGVPALHDRDFYVAGARERLRHLADEHGVYRWYASARATAPCRVIELPRDAVHELCERHPRLAAAAANLQIRLLQNQVSHLVRNDAAMIEGKDAEIRTQKRGHLLRVMAAAFT